MARESLPITILYSTSGPYAALGRDATDGALAAVAEVNADAQLPFRFVAHLDDPSGRAEQYALSAEAFIRRSGCRHVIGTITSWSRKEVLPVVERHGALLWYAFPYEGYEASNSVIYLGACPNQHLLPLFDHVLPRYGRRPFIVGSNYIWGWEISRIARERTDASGGQVVAERFMPLGSVEVDHLISEIRQKKPDFILSNLVGQSACAFIEAYSAARSADCPVVACNMAETDLDGLLPQARSGHISTSIYFNRLQTADNHAFKQRMAARVGGERRITTPFMSAYMAVTILARAIADAGTDDPKAISRSVTSRQFDSPIGPLTIDPLTHHAALRPHIGISDSTGSFDLFQSAADPIPADPFLVGMHPTMAANPAADRAAGASPLKVIK